jgi:glycosyltransferase involved in cell wall biosynthesis
MIKLFSLEQFGIPDDKIIFSRYGFNLNNFKNSKKIYSDKLRFAFIGNFLPAKGLHILIDAFNRVKGKNVELKIYGKVLSYKALLENYFKYVKKMAKNKNIKFMGGFDNREIAKIFSQIDVLIVPSIWYENSPLVIQEAFATNTPVIASRIGGIAELIDGGKNGLLFEPNSVDDLYAKMSQLIENRWLLKELSQQQTPIKTVEENAQEVEKIYTTLMARNIASVI